MNQLTSLLTTLAFTIDANDAGIPRVAANEGTSNSIMTGVFMIAGAVTVLFIIISAFRYVISQGDSARVAQAKDGILYGLAGLVITALAFTIVQVVINVIAGRMP